MGRNVEDKQEHIPVFPAETMEALRVRPDGIYADLTAGKGGGHTFKILEQLTTGKVVAVDRDPVAVESLRRLAGEDGRIRIVNDNFANIAAIWIRERMPPADGILIDLGFSSQQIADPEKGLSFQVDGPLCMKYDPNEAGPTAAEIVNGAPEEYLRDLFFRFGERHARRIARRIVEERAKNPIETTGRLAGLISKIVPSKPGKNPSTHVFLALRSEVNREIEAIEAAVPAALGLLKPGGRLVVITYQSEEDRTVKELFRRAEKGCRCALPADECLCSYPPTAKRVNRKVIKPSEQEININIRSRSAKMRVVEAL